MTRPRSLDHDALTKKVVELRKQGLTIAKIAAQVGCSASMVRHFVPEDLRKIGAGAKITPHAIKEIIAAKRNGETLRQISYRHGVTITRIWQIIRKHAPELGRKK